MRFCLQNFIYFFLVLLIFSLNWGSDLHIFLFSLQEAESLFCISTFLFKKWCRNIFCQYCISKDFFTYLVLYYTKSRLEGIRDFLPQTMDFLPHSQGKRGKTSILYWQTFCDKTLQKIRASANKLCKHKV